MRKLIFPILAVVLAFAASAFTTNKRVNSDFYVYTGLTHSQTDIQTAGNYKSTTSNPCGGVTTNVCGVTLATALPVGSSPDPGEFSDEEDNLWTSQQNHSPIDGTIEMRP